MGKETQDQERVESLLRIIAKLPEVQALAKELKFGSITLKVQDAVVTDGNYSGNVRVN